METSGQDKAIPHRKRPEHEEGRNFAQIPSRSLIQKAITSDKNRSTMSIFNRYPLPDLDNLWQDLNSRRQLIAKEAEELRLLMAQTHKDLDPVQRSLTDYRAAMTILLRLASRKPLPKPSELLTPLSSRLLPTPDTELLRSSAPIQRRSKHLRQGSSSSRQKRAYPTLEEVYKTWSNMTYPQRLDSLSELAMTINHDCLLRRASYEARPRKQIARLLRRLTVQELVRPIAEWNRIVRDCKPPLTARACYDMAHYLNNVLGTLQPEDEILSALQGIARTIVGATLAVFSPNTKMPKELLPEYL